MKRRLQGSRRASPALEVMLRLPLTGEDRTVLTNALMQLCARVVVRTLVSIPHNAGLADHDSDKTIPKALDVCLQKVGFPMGEDGEFVARQFQLVYDAEDRDEAVADGSAEVQARMSRIIGEAEDRAD